MRIRETKGFSLIELLVLGGISAGIMAGVASFLTQSGRAQKSAAQASNFEELVSLLKLVLRNPTTCRTAFQNAAGDPAEVPTTIKVATPNLPLDGLEVSKIVAGNFVLDSTIARDALYITKIRITQIVAGSPANGSPSPYVTFLHLEGSKTASGAPAAMGGGSLRADIPLSLTLQLPAGPGAAKIASCSTSSSGPGTSTDIEWVSLPAGGIQGSDHVYYNDGIDHSPMQVCVAAGYTSFSGACRAVLPGGVRIAGAVVSNNQTYFPNWGLACSYGSGAFYFSSSSAQSQILCIK